MLKWRIAEAQIAVKNAAVIRAALKQSVDPAAIVAGYMETHPQPSDNPAMDKAKALAWLILHAQFDNAPLTAAYRKLYSEGYAIGLRAADQMIASKIKQNKAGELDPYTDWQHWKPGNAAAALLVSPPEVLQRLLNQAQGFQSLNRESVARMSTAIAEGIRSGASSKTIASWIVREVASPSRALTIATTEQNRAVSLATAERYRAAGLERMEWQTSDPCDVCAANDGQVVALGEAFNSGDTEPPAHPNCRCTLVPVIEEAQPDFVDVAPRVEAPTAVGPEEVAPTGDGFVPGQWRQLEQAEIQERVIAGILEDYKGILSRDNVIRRLELGVKPFKAEASLYKKGNVYVNGGVEARFFMTGSSVSAKQREAIFAHLEQLQMSNPQGSIIFSVGPSNKNAYGWAYLGGRNIWIAPNTAKKLLEPNFLEASTGFKMPAAGQVPQWKYTITHEWGHHVDVGDSRARQLPERSAVVTSLLNKYPDEFLSKYGKSNTSEAFAEMFAEWYLSEGKTANQLVQAAAKEFGWKI